jgi:metal-responsive CopG/Arc/MetJ family transcriptional regulator
MRSIRVERKLWDEFGALAEAEGAERSEVLRDYIRQYVAEHRPEDDASE